jgi:hypothetical protein
MNPLSALQAAQQAVQAAQAVQMAQAAQSAKDAFGLLGSALKVPNWKSIGYKARSGHCDQI